VILAADVLREAWRDRWLAVGPSSVVLLVPLVGGAERLALGAGAKAAADVGLFAVWGLCAVLSLTLGLSALRASPERLWALVRPISRTRFLSERFAGVCAALALQVVALHAAWLVAALLAGVPVPPGLWAAAVLSWVEACVLAALAALFVQVQRPLPAGLCAAAVAVVGHLADEYRAIAADGDVPAPLARALFLAVPDLDRLDVQGAVVHGLVPDPGQLALAVGYGAAWCAALVLLATVALERRDVP
jgi:hypothetical protein